MPRNNSLLKAVTKASEELNPNDALRPLSDYEQSSSAFLDAWDLAHWAVKHHVYRDLHHPHYINVNLFTGSAQALWIDSLGAYYPGLLSIAGELDEAIEAHLLYTALWTRYSALPERWSTGEGSVEGGLGWWPGRPEFIESTYHLYRATKDPWYLHVGEMVLRDIQRRCRTKCGWAGLQDVRTGELSDRMESFFLGETAKYLFLLFETAHPLNDLDASFVFTTEGHPLLLPKQRSAVRRASELATSFQPTCPRAPPPLPLSISSTAARHDIFHAASFTKLHLIKSPNNVDSSPVEFASGHPSVVASNDYSPTNHTFYPWTLPLELVPAYGFSSIITSKPSFDIQFPNASPNILAGQQSLLRVADGLMVNSLDGLRLGMILDGPPSADSIGTSKESYRIYNLGNFALGRDEKIFINRDTLGNMVDPNFTRYRDSSFVELVIDSFGVPLESSVSSTFSRPAPAQNRHRSDKHPAIDHPQSSSTPLSGVQGILSSILNQLSPSPPQRPPNSSPPPRYRRVSASSATGIGAAPLPDIPSTPDPSSTTGYEVSPLPFSTIHLGDTACSGPLPRHIPSTNQVIVLRRGECSFSEKLRNVPSFAPGKKALQLVIIVSDDNAEERTSTIRPLLDEVQKTPAGLGRPYAIPVVMIGGGEDMYEMLGKAKSIGIKRRYFVRSQGVLVGNLIVL